MGAMQSDRYNADARAHRPFHMLKPGVCTETDCKRLQEHVLRLSKGEFESAPQRGAAIAFALGSACESVSTHLDFVRTNAREIRALVHDDDPLLRLVAPLLLLPPPPPDDAG